MQSFLLYLLALAALVLAAAPASAAEPPATPLLRIETGMHAATVRRLVFDRAGNRLITAGDDKAVRIWQLPEGRLASVLRIPVGTGHEGRIFAISVSPDGKLVAVGGWTGWDWEQKGSVYLFDAESAELVRRIGGLPDIVGTTAFSPDGRYLAVGLQGRAGLQVFRTSDWSSAARDDQYNDKILGLDFARDGRLAASSLDGQLRIYDPNLKLIGRKRSEPGTKPLTVRFSPDGAQLAVSFHDSVSLAVHSTRDFSLAFTTDASKITRQTRMADVAWSSDGESLYGCGDYSGAGENPIYRWRNGGRGAMETIPVANQRLTDLQTMPGGGVAFTAEDPAIGVIDAAGAKTLFIGPELADFREGESAFRVSNDGSIVEFPYAANGGRPVRFSLFERALGKASQERVAPALRSVPEFALENWKDATAPVLNGRKLELDDYEVTRSYAVSASRRVLVLGSEWALRAYDPGGRQLWKTEAPGVVWNVAVTGDEKSAVATLGDGTVRWYRLEDGVEYLALFPHGAGEEWIAWIPQGYYVSSNYGDNFVGWHLNRGKDRSADFFRAVQFERILYRPDVVGETFRSRALASGTVVSRAAGEFDIRQLAAIAPPRIRITGMVPAQGADGASRVRLTFAVEKNSLDMQEYAVFVNNIPVTPAVERRLRGGETAEFVREAELELTGRENVLRIEVSNGRSIGLVEKFYAPTTATIAAPAPGNLYLLAIGVNQFPNLKGANLAYAARDAEEVERFFKSRSAGHYSQVFTKVLSDSSDVKPVTSEIMRALDFINSAQARDTVIVFLASHGISDASGAYYFVARDAIEQDVRTVQQGGERPITSLVAWTTFFDALRRVAGRRLLIVDTCQAKNIEGRVDLHSLAKRSASALFSLVVASKGDEESQEYAPEKHGLFTFALLQGLGGPSDADRDGFINLREAFAYTLPVVEKLRSKTVGPQSPQLIAPEPLGNMVLARALQAAPSAAAAPLPADNAGCGVRTLIVGKRDPRCAP